MRGDSSVLPNVSSSKNVRSYGNDRTVQGSQNAIMSVRRRSTPPENLGHHWFLSDWAKLRAKRQADAQRDLHWSKATASALWNGKQRYTQDLVDQVANWLEIEPFEVLMRPDEAIALRRLRETAAQIVAEDRTRPFIDAPPSRKVG